MTLSKILIVDDEKDNLDALRRLLRKDYEVHTALSGEEAAELYAHDRHWDAVISDQRMPGMSGSALFEKIQSLDETPTRILLTGFADMDAVIEAINRGHIWRYIAKPWEPDDLKLAIAQAVERTRLKRSLDQSRKELERALNGLRARDWSRERLLQILLHEFRSAPQILENVLELSADPGSTHSTGKEAPPPPANATGEKFLRGLIARFGRLEKEILELSQEEKLSAQLPRESLDLKQLLETLGRELGFTLQNHLPPGVSAPVQIHAESLEKIFRHFYALIAKNSAQAPVQVSLEALKNPELNFFISFVISSDFSQPLLPMALNQQNLAPSVAWPALLEPFVGGDDFLLHSEGLRLETARWVRMLAALGGKSEFVISGKDASMRPDQTQQIEWVVVLKGEQDR